MNHRRLTLWLWSAGTWLASRRRVRIRREDEQRFVYRHQTRLMGVRLTEWLRDRLRPRWLRLRKFPLESSDGATEY